MTDTFKCPRCRGKVRVTMSDGGLRFADKDGQSGCPDITDKYIEYGALPFDDFALCEALIGEVERRYSVPHEHLMAWYDVLTPALSEAAYRARNGEMAWPREHALSVVLVLEQNGYEIIGIDIWLPTVPGPTIPTPFIYDWDSGCTWPESTAKSPATFVATFDWDPSDHASRGKDPYFNIWAQHGSEASEGVKK
jgi:hypothetical protein